MGDGVNLDTVELLHRSELQQEAYVAVCRKIAGQWDNVGGFRMKEMYHHQQQLLPLLIEDSYFSLNSFFRAKNYQTAHGYPWPARSRKDLRYLNACYLDIDFYKNDPDATYGDVMKQVVDAQDAGAIPHASIIVRSGRGMYLIWILLGEQPGELQTAFSYEVQCYEQVNRALGNACAKFSPLLKPDGIHDAPRVLRMDGSINSTAGQAVEWMLQGRNDRLFTYTLKELALAAGVRPPIPTYERLRAAPFYREVENPGSAPNRRKGKLQREQNRMSDVLTIEQDRGGFKKGKRRRSITYLAQFAKGAGMSYSEVLKQCDEVGRRCDPPFPWFPEGEKDQTIKEIVSAVFSEDTKRHRNHDLAFFFEVTEEDAERLELVSIIPNAVKWRRDAQPTPRQAEQERRRETIREYLEDYFKAVGGTIPVSAGKVRNHLISKRFEVTAKTVRRDLDALGYEYFKRRPRKQADPEQESML